MDKLVAQKTDVISASLRETTALNKDVVTQRHAALPSYRNERNFVNVGVTKVFRRNIGLESLPLTVRQRSEAARVDE